MANCPNDTVKSPCYNHYEMGSEYKADQGLLVVPIAGDPGVDQSGNPNPSFKLVRVYNPIGRRKVTYHVEKSGTPPVVPAAVDTPMGDKLLSSDVTIPLPTLDTNLSAFNWQIDGEYEYVQSHISQARSVPASSGPPQGGFDIGGFPMFIPPLDNLGAYPGIDTAGIPQGNAAAYAFVNFNSQAYTYADATFFPGVFFSECLFG